MAETPPQFNGQSHGSTGSRDDTEFALKQLEYWQSVVRTRNSDNNPLGSQSRSPSTSRETIASQIQNQHHESALQNLLQPLQPVQTRNLNFQHNLERPFSYDRQTTTSPLDNLNTSAERSSFTQPIASSSDYRVRAGNVGNVTTPLFSSDLERKSWLANDKRSRNTEASARFRAKKKLYAEELQHQISSLSDRIVKMDEEIVELRRENRWLRELVVEKNQVPDDKS